MLVNKFISMILLSLNFNKAFKAMALVKTSILGSGRAWDGENIR